MNMKTTSSAIVYSSPQRRNRNTNIEEKYCFLWEKILIRAFGTVLCFIILVLSKQLCV